MNFNCPRCGAELNTIRFEELDQGTAFGKIMVDRCDSCGGVWFDQGELERVQDIIDVSFVEIRKIPARREQQKPLQCPKCKRPVMEKLQNDRDRKVVMDVCPECKGIWLDAGELEAIQKENLLSLFLILSVGW